MKRIMMGVAAVATLLVPVAGVGTAVAAEPGPAAKTTDSTAAPLKAAGYWCDQSGIGTGTATATCYNETDQARYAHFHVDCWAIGDSDTDQNKWVGPWGSVSFNHGCWSKVQGIEAFFQ